MEQSKFRWVQIIEPDQAKQINISKSSHILNNPRIHLTKYIVVRGSRWHFEILNCDVFVF